MAFCSVERALCHVVYSVSKEHAAVIFRTEVDTVTMHEATLRHVLTCLVLLQHDNVSCLRKEEIKIILCLSEAFYCANVENMVSS